MNATHLPPAPELMTATLEPSDAESSAAATLVVVDAALLLLGDARRVWAMGRQCIVEEKSSRVVKVHLSAVPARHLPADKDRDRGWSDSRNSYASPGSLQVSGRLPKAERRAAGQPVTYTLLTLTSNGYGTVSADSSGTLAHVVTVLPLTAPLVLPRHRVGTVVQCASST